MFLSKEQACRVEANRHYCVRRTELATAGAELAIVGGSGGTGSRSNEGGKPPGMAGRG